MDNTEDVIDSRDVLERIEELRDASSAPLDEAEASELRALLVLASQDESCEDWQHGVTLVRGSFFVEYAQELAEDIGAIDGDAAWPARCIDWERAAKDLQTDYTPIEFGGVTYWAR
jgi:hypothetical protein